MNKTKQKHKWIKPVVIIVAVVIALSILLLLLPRGNSDKAFAQTKAERRDIATYYSFSGNVKAYKEYNINAKVSQKVLSVNVSEGDEVKAGDIIAVLESEDIQKNIEKKQITMSSSEISDSYNVLSARQNYENYAAALKNGTNASLNNAQNTLDNAKRMLDDRQSDYDEKLEELEAGSASALLSARQNLENAERRLSTAEKDYLDYFEEKFTEKNSSLINAQDNVNTAKRRLENAQSDYDEAVDAFENGNDSSLQAAEQNVDSAYRRLSNARTTYRDYKADNGYDSTDIRDAEKAVDSARKKLNDAAAALDEFLQMNDGSSVSTASELINTDSSKLKELQEAVEDARYEYEAALDDLAYIKTADEMLSNYYESYLTARDNYDTAERNLQDVKKRIEKSVKTAEDTLTAAKEGYDSALRSLSDMQKSVDKNLETYHENFLSAQDSYETAKRNLADTEKSLGDGLKNARDAVEKAQESYDQALKNYNIVKNDADQTLKNYKDSYEKTLKLSELSTASIELADLYEQLDNCTIKAEYDGIISKVNLKEGSYSSANQAAAMITDYSKLKITAKIDEYDIANVERGDKVDVYINATDKTVEGEITYISPEAELSGGVAYFTADISFSANASVKAGMSAEIKLQNQYVPNVLTVLVDALRHDDLNNVYVLVKGPSGKTEQRYIKVGASDGEYIEITEGLDEGDIVLYTPVTSMFPFQMMAGG